MRILLIKVVVISFERVDANLPGKFIFDSRLEAVRFPPPPCLLGVELFDANGLCLTVALVAARILVLVIPGVLCRGSFGKEQKVSFDSRVRVKDAVWEPDDGMEITFSE